MIRLRDKYQLLKLYAKTASRRFPRISGFDISYKPIVLIHQMGKVGSLSIYRSLKATYSQLFDIYHTHFLNPHFALESDRERQANDWKFYTQRQNNNRQPIGYHGVTRIHSQLLVKPQQPLNIITMVRDPIARNISAYFQNLHWILGDAQAYKKKSVHELAQIFWMQADHDFPLDWLDREIREVVGLDIYAHKFPHNQGVQQLSKGIHNLLIMHTKTPDLVKEQSIQKFLGIEQFKIVRSHASDTKPYGDIYKKFIREVEIPLWYVDKMFNSQFAQHFYSEDERQKKIAYWLNHPRL